MHAPDHLLGALPLCCAGHVGVRGSGPGYLNEPDDAYQLPNGLVSVADIGNCRILFLSPVGAVVRQYGRTGICVHDPPSTFASPNGDTPLPDGGMAACPLGPHLAYRVERGGRWRCLGGGGVMSRTAAAVGGLLYGFSPDMTGQAMAHPQMTLAVAPPLTHLLVGGARDTAVQRSGQGLTCPCVLEWDIAGIPLLSCVALDRARGYRIQVTHVVSPCR